ncbi:putative Glutaredoxin [Trypanosoma vivax]|uniref:Putative glutaredoxin-like protein n=1 Tax=Trypanosoma vivax (strain Y486) TaxID=1055687 RepID=G0U1Z2_TRYVY|nr:putative glutaredoxin-like protein [Trypanosoma vivax]KAH8618666.1 putative Glutaredoxin [Trypanosoma vivax]CCC50293.1 putative glutaredoxin-like protein [Trypanosoma vivax Y486]
MQRLSSFLIRRAGVAMFMGSIPNCWCLQPVRPFHTTTVIHSRSDVVGGDVHDTEWTHPDFQPRIVSTDIAEDEVMTVKKDIDDTIKSEDVVAFIKGLPEAPMCAFSKRMVDVLEALGLEYTSFDVLAHPVVRTYVKEISEWPTIPQLFVKGEFVGGLDIVLKMLESGELKKLLQSKGIDCRNL